MRGRQPPAAPIVSVVIPVWNVEPYLRACLDSVLDQTIGRASLEIIAVDDGSTDGSGPLLDACAAEHPELTVIHQPNSGGPGGPRNAGLERARGRYVFFLDADDYLGAEALERMVAMAERNGSDVVLGRMVGVDGRAVPTAAFRRSRDRATVEQVYSSTSALKLFRRSLLERLGLRFGEGMAGGEDGPFTARAYLEAGVISVVGDYDCYYARSRRGSQTRRADRRDDLVEHIRRVEAQRISLVAAHRPPGPARDALMIKHVIDVLRPFRARWLALEPAARHAVFEAAADVLRRWNTPAIRRRLPAWYAIRAWCLEHDREPELEAIVACPEEQAFGRPIVEGERVYAAWPHFRDAAGIPDACFDITDRIRLRARVTRAHVDGERLELGGHAYLNLVGGETSLVLRRWPRGPSYRIAVRATDTPQLRDRRVAHPRAGFTASLNLGGAANGQPLAPGSWQVLLVVRGGGVERVVPLRRSHLASAARRSHHAADGRPGPGRLAMTRSGELRLRVGRIGLLTRVLESVEAASAAVRPAGASGLAEGRLGGPIRQLVERAAPGVLGRSARD